MVIQLMMIHDEDKYKLSFNDTDLMIIGVVAYCVPCVSVVPHLDLKN